MKEVLLKDILKRDSNNLDLFRIIAACMVIIGHSYVLFPQAGTQDLIRSWTGFTYSGALAVKIFFFISGLVVTNSLLLKRSAPDFVVSRLFRIFPGLAFLLLVSALAIAPFMSSFNLHQYFDTPATYNYIKENLVLKTNYNLPRVFEHNPYVGAVNGSLWTLPSETGCYLFLLGLFLLGVFSRRVVANAVFLIIIFDALLQQPLLIQWLGNNTESSYLPACFSAGALLAINADRMMIGSRQFFGFALLTYLLWNTRFAELLFCFSSFSLIIWASSSAAVMKMKPKYDVSYGIYLWGFFVQQCVACLLPAQGLYIKMLISLILSGALGALSWFAIEKPAIAAGKKLISRFKGGKPEPEISSAVLETNNA